ncbi:MAG: TatD family hydrolase [Clostridia bacterium]|jgi:TatD DNase family protein|nr:TatD family hydrolase [Clostridia bacterium]
MPIFDSHAHYLDTAFDSDREVLLTSLFENGVCGIIEAATSANSASLAVALAHRFPHLFAAVGIHPEDAGNAIDSDLQVLSRLAADEKVVAIGEIGLDYHYDDACPRDIQQQWFCRQLELAHALDLPVVVHDREAHEDTLCLLQKYRPRGVVHCFSGSTEMAREIVNLGMYIGIGGVVTFKNARKLTEVAAVIPPERLLLETDAPYLAPEPYRGKRCDSSKIFYTAAAIAALRGVSTETVLQWGEQNACELYNIPRC